MISAIANVLAPHYCCGCGKIGKLLCESCQNDIISEATEQCVLCKKPSTGKCSSCVTSYDYSRFAAERTGPLETLINETKFESRRAGCNAQARLLDAILPRLPQKCVVVAVPTISTHIRQRGYGHAEQIGKYLAKLRRVQYQQVIVRTQRQLVQYGSNRKTRIENAAKSYKAFGTIDPDATYLLVDDVVTTGASVEYAAKALKDAGASQVWVAVTARQPLKARQSRQSST